MSVGYQRLPQCRSRMTGIATPPWVVPGPKFWPGARLTVDPLSKFIVVGLTTV